MSAPTLAGWFPDPFARHELRYWDGAQWTDGVASDGVQTVDPPISREHVPMTVESGPAADWYADPAGRHELRFWDGERWTHHVATRGVQAMEDLRQKAHLPAMKVQSGDTKSVASSVDSAPVPPQGALQGETEKGARLSPSAGRLLGGGLLAEDLLIVNQKAKVLGSRVEYAVHDQDGRQIGTIRELRRTLSATVNDGLLGRNELSRERRYELVDRDQQVVLAMTRPAMGWFATKGRFVVEGRGGTILGHVIHESFGVKGAAGTAARTGVTNASTLAAGVGGLVGTFAAVAMEGVQDRLDSAVEGWGRNGHARFGLESASGQRLGSVNAETSKQWDFDVRDPGGVEIARITKTWAGWTKERFTKADNYVVEMPHALDEHLRSLIIAAAMAIDVELKERGDQTKRTSLRRPRTYK